MDALKTEAQHVLEARRRALLLLTQAEREEGERHRDHTDDRSDEADGDETSEVLDRLSSRERTELREIEAALGRIRTGTFGLCEACGQAIGRQRLRALPETRHCLACATRASVA